MNGLIVGVLFVGGIIGLYFLTYLLNKNTAVPEGTVPIDKCSTCGSGSCSLARKEEFRTSPDTECEIYETEHLN